MKRSERLHIVMKNCCPYYGSLTQELGSVGATLLFSNLYFAHTYPGIPKNRGGWFWRNISTIMNMTGMSAFQVRRAASELVELKVVQTMHDKPSRRTYWRLDDDLIDVLPTKENTSTGTESVQETDRVDTSTGTEPAQSEKLNLHRRSFSPPYIGKEKKEENKREHRLRDGDDSSDLDMLGSAIMGEDKPPRMVRRAPVPEDSTKGDDGRPPKPTFEQYWAMYPDREGPCSKHFARRAWNGRIREGVDPALLINQVELYSRYCKLKGWIGTPYVMQPSSFIGDRKRGWEDDWATQIRLAMSNRSNGNGKQGKGAEQIGGYKPVEWH